VASGSSAIALPILGVVAFADLVWTEHCSSTVGYSAVFIDNAAGQSASAFKAGHYALANILVTPVKNFMMGAEFQFGRRLNFQDGFDVNDFRLQFSFKYSFGHTFSGE
jgi:hypothetical protein